MHSNDFPDKKQGSVSIIPGAEFVKKWIWGDIGPQCVRAWVRWTSNYWAAPNHNDVAQSTWNRTRSNLAALATTLINEEIKSKCNHQRRKRFLINFLHRASQFACECFDVCWSTRRGNQFDGLIKLAKATESILYIFYHRMTDSIQSDCYVLLSIYSQIYFGQRSI